MELYLVAGGNSEALKQNLEKTGEIQVVKYDRTIDYLFNNLKSGSVKFDAILLTDQGISCSLDEFSRIIGELKELLKSHYCDAEFKFVTKEYLYEQAFKRITRDESSCKAYYTDKIKIPLTFLYEACMERSEGHRITEKKIPWSPFKRTEKQQVEHNYSDSSSDKTHNPDNKHNHGLPSDRLSTVSSSINRIIAITGHRGAGATSTAANLAVASSMHGLKTIILDLDFEYRAMNLYFGEFGDKVDQNADLAAALVKCLLKPDSYEKNSCRINENLMLVTLAYSMSSKDKLLDFITAKRLLSLVTALKSKYNLVLLDIPLHVLRDFSDLLIHLDSIGLCLNNNLYSVINTVKAVSGSFEGENLTALKMKSKAVVTKYNDGNKHNGRKLTESLTCEILCEISDTLGEKVNCAGIIPYTKDFDQQVDTGKKLCTISNEYKRYYTGILNNLI